MPKYRVLEKSFIGVHLVEAGAEVEYDGLPGKNLEPLDDEAKAQAAKAQPVANAAMKDLIANMRPLGDTDPEAFAAAVAKAIADGIAQALAPKGKPKGDGAPA